MIVVKPGAYVIAVSGGVDSVVLLELLSKLPNLKLTIAHFDHGIREDSDADRQFVQGLAGSYKLPFVFEVGNLGPKASEEIARAARYAFLTKVQQATGADAIITAHHQDDALETAIINMLRGTGRRGLSSLKSHEQIIRPMLGISKQEILDYAKAHKLKWHEDSTNQDTVYLRNYVRHNIIAKFTLPQKQTLLGVLAGAHKTNEAIDQNLEKLLSAQPHKAELNRKDFVQLPHNVAREVMAAWLRQNGINKYDSKLLELLVMAAKTFKPGKNADINSTIVLSVLRDSLALTERER